MNYPFMEGKKYFTTEEAGQLAKFFALFPHGYADPNYVFVNGDGEKREPKHIFLPQGCITSQTRYYNHPTNGERYYYTPNANRRGATTVGINYVDPDTGVRGDCNSDEWLEWLGDKWSFDRPSVMGGDAGDKLAETKINAMAIVANNTVDFRELDKETATAAEAKEPIWTSPIKKRKSSKKGS